MPVVLNPTYLKDIAVIDYKDLTAEEIKKDTETVDGKFYALPKTRLIWLRLWTEGHEWGTMRRFTPEKFKYYSGLVGQEVHVEIAGQQEYNKVKLPYERNR
jgi:hypothetical protein